MGVLPTDYPDSTRRPPAPQELGAAASECAWEMAAADYGDRITHRGRDDDQERYVFFFFFFFFFMSGTSFQLRIAVGVAGRMNAKGVSVFYGATEKENAISEVRPPVGCHVVVGTFKPIRTLRLLDLHQLGSITLKPTSSLFDPATAGEAARCAFMETLTQKMVMPVMPELEEQGYLITQAIADFLSTHPKLVLDGIIFPSAQNTTVHKDTPGRNVVLFNKASMVLNADADYGGDHVELWEYDEDSPKSWFKPEMWLSQREGTRNTSMWLIPAPIKPALELDLNSIEIYEVEGVKYQKTGHQVKRHIVQPKMIKNDRPAVF